MLDGFLDYHLIDAVNDSAHAAHVLFELIEVYPGSLKD